MKQNLGFKAVLISSMVVIFLIALAITSYISIYQLEDVVKQDVIHKISNAASYETESIESYVVKNSQPIADLAELYRKYGYNDRHEKHIEFAAVTGGLSKITLGFIDGRSYSSKPSAASFPGGIGRLDKYDPRTRPWFQFGRKQSSLALTDVFFTKKGDPIAAAVQPIKDGVLTADIRLTTLQQIVENIDILPGTISMVVDGNGMVLASTAEQIKIQQQLTDADGFGQYMQIISSQDSTFNELTIAGIERFVLSSKIKLIGGKQWYLINAVDKQVALAPVSQATQQLLLFCALIIALSVVVLIIVINRIYRPVIELKSLVSRLANGDGDLTQRLEVRTQDDLGEIASGINRFIDSLNSMLLEVKSVTTQLVDSVRQLRVSTQTNTAILSDHQAETNQVVVAMDELGTSSEMVAHNAAEAARFIEEANQSGEQSRETILTAQRGLALLSEEIDGTTAKVTQMSDETKGISSILSVIGEIAEQTNLLALNAAIEAARAGEQGRGFAVVADEVRALAGRTQLSTGEINKSLAQLQSGADSVVNSIDSTKATSGKTVDEANLIAESLEAMTGYVAQINQVGTQISQSADEQNNVIQEISQNMNRIDTMVAELTDNGSTMARGTDDIAQINNQLSAIVSKFRLVEH